MVILIWMAVFVLTADNLKRISGQAEGLEFLSHYSFSFSFSFSFSLVSLIARPV
jgi:hypothetical protein